MLHKIKNIGTQAVMIVGLLLVAGVQAQAAISVSPKSISFGNEAVGVAHAPMVVTLKNNNKNEITIMGASIGASQFAFGTQSFPVLLSPGASLSVSVTFTPTAAQTYSSRLVFERQTGPTISVGLSGTGVTAIVSNAPTAPLITTPPLSETVTLGQTASFQVAATGTSPMTFQWSKNGAAISNATSSGYTTPATSATDNGAQFSVVITNSAGKAVSNAATLTVKSASTAILNSSVTSLSFGTVNVSSTSTQNVTLTNAGNTNVNVSSVTISGAGFTAGGVSTGLILTPGQAATLTVTFTPSAAGSVTGNVSIASNATNSPDSLSLSGTGASQAPAVALSWGASPSSVIGYNTYSSGVSGGPYVKLTSSPVNALNYTDTTVKAGQTYYYVVTSVNSANMESGYSGEVSTTVP